MTTTTPPPTTTTPPVRRSAYDQHGHAYVQLDLVDAITIQCALRSAVADWAPPGCESPASDLPGDEQQQHLASHGAALRAISEAIGEIEDAADDPGHADSDSAAGTAETATAELIAAFGRLTRTLGARGLDPQALLETTPTTAAAERNEAGGAV